MAKKLYTDWMYDLCTEGRAGTVFSVLEMAPEEFKSLPIWPRIMEAGVVALGEARQPRRAEELRLVVCERYPGYAWHD